ncbi:DUF1919 domain-containing protein [Bariatricus sp. HCP3S3_E12]|uniref:DUF1919 domain-containing protein n=1 Tax=Bariatricus sp. HCP3S3_E12 TaxID=3438906 RepID=UPI003F8C5AEF
MYIIKKVLGKIEDTLRKSFIRELGANIHNKRLRARLTNDNFSILCPNCIGGTMYKKLGKQFLSPTINLWMTQRDFIKFAVNLKEYIKEDLKFVETDKNYPVATLGDIELNFLHYKTEQEAEEAWNRRKQRINYDNIYILLYYRDGYTIDEIREIEKAVCRNLVLLTAKPLPLDYAQYIKPRLDRPNGDSFIDDNIWGTRTFEKQWDFVGWLNSDKNS